MAWRSAVFALWLDLGAEQEEASATDLVHADRRGAELLALCPSSAPPLYAYRRLTRVCRIPNHLKWHQASEQQLELLA